MFYFIGKVILDNELIMLVMLVHRNLLTKYLNLNTLVFIIYFNVHAHVFLILLKQSFDYTNPPFSRYIQFLIECFGTSFECSIQLQLNIAQNRQNVQLTIQFF